MNHEQFMALAIAKAQSGINSGQTPFGACIVRDGQVLSCEHNVVWQTTDINAHAEVTAIRKACLAAQSIDLSGAIMYTTCEPCPMCFSAAHWARISTIVYGATITDATTAGFNELVISAEAMKTAGNTGVELVSGVMSQECSALFALWKSTIGHKTY